eukprot:722940_1
MIKPCALIFLSVFLNAKSQGSFNTTSVSTTQHSDCGFDEYQCVTSKACIPNSYLCDQFKDCDGGDDEHNCCQVSNNTEITCSDSEFTCKNCSCIPITFQCDGVWDCPDGSDEVESVCNGPYMCWFNDNKIYASDIMDKSLDSAKEYDIQPITKEEAEQMVEIVSSVSSVVDVQDSLALVSLLLMNIAISIFIIIGLLSYHHKKQFKHIDISYVTIIIIIIQHILLTTINLFDSPVITCTVKGQQTGTPLDLIQYTSSIILWLIWVKYFYVDERGTRRLGCALFVLIVTFIVPAFVIFAIPVIGADYIRYGGGVVVFVLCQTSLPIFWCLIIMQEKTEMNGLCRGCVQRPCVEGRCREEKKGQWWCNGCCIWFLQFVSCLVWLMVVIYEYEQAYPNMCFFIAGMSWLNPMWIIFNIMLLFSPARLPIIMYNVMILIITAFGWKVAYMCSMIININFVVHALFIPLYIMVIFYSVKELSQWKTDLIQMYLVAFDIVTDIIVIYYFANNKHYIFAVLSSIFIVLGQIVGTFSEHCTGHKSETLTTTDKIMAALGFSSPWFIINSWSDPRYYILEHKHQIWEMMFENMPGVALQVYAAITQEEGGASLGISITVSVITITFSLWMYLVKLTRLKRELKDINTTTDPAEDNANEKPNTTDVVVSTTTESLPPGWRQLQHFDGKIYYQNDITKQTQWEKPKPIDESLPDGWRRVQGKDGKIYYQNDATKQSQWEKPKAVEGSLPEGWRRVQGNDGKVYYQNDITQETQWTDPSATVTALHVKEEKDDETDKAKAIKKGRERVRTMTTEEVEYEDQLQKLKTSRAVPKYMRVKFGDVLINRTLYFALYLFMVSDFYLRTISIVIIISSIPCPAHDDFCGPRIGVGSGVFLGLFIFAFVMNKRMRIESYRSCGFIGTIFSVSLLSSFYNVLASLRILKDDIFFGQSVKFESFLFEHKIRIWISLALNVVSIPFFFLNDDASRNEFIAVLMALFFVALFVNYMMIRIVGKYIDSEKTYTFNIFKCKEHVQEDEQRHRGKVSKDTDAKQNSDDNKKENDNDNNVAIE